MAARNKKGSTNKVLDVSMKLLPRIGIAAGRTLIEKVWPELKVITKGANVLRMQCPFHTDATPSCDWNFTSGLIHCYGCGRSFFSIFKALQISKGWSHKQSLDTIRQYIDLRTINDAMAKEIDAVDIWYSAVEITAKAYNQHLVNLLSGVKDTYYTDGLRDAVAPTLHWLYDERKRNKDVAWLCPYGIMPPALLFKHLIEDLMEKEVRRREQRKLSYPGPEWRKAVIDKAMEQYATVHTSYVHSWTTHNGSDFTTYSRIKYRRPCEDKADNIFVSIGRTPDEPLGFFGLCRQQFFERGVSDAKELFVQGVEGEHDALSLIEGEILNNVSGVLTLATGGTANAMDDLAKCGLNTVYLVSDHPEQGGDDYVANRLGSAEVVRVEVFNRWGPIRKEYPLPKDPDEFIRVAGYEAAKTLFHSKRNYVSAHEWAYAKVLDEITDQDADAAQDLREVLSLVERYGQCVRHPAEQTRFVDMVSALTHIPTGELRKAIISGKNDEASFILALTSRIQDEFYALYCVPTARSPILRMFHRERRIAVDFLVNDGDAMGLSLSRIHGSVYEWVKDHVGLPMFLLGGDDDAPNVTPEKIIAPVLAQYLKLAGQKLLQGVPMQSECIEYGQGIHPLPDPVTGKLVTYILNGDRVYKGHPSEMSNRIDWEELPGPADGHHLFRTMTRAWSAMIQSAADLNAGNDITKEMIWERAVKAIGIVKLGWVFAHRDIDSEFLVYQLLACTISHIWPRKTIQHFVGNSNTGKSTALALFTGHSHPALRMLEMSIVIDNFTEASVFQTLSRCTLLACFDEFEEEGDDSRAAVAVALVTKLMRNVNLETGVPVRRGTQDGLGREYLVHTAMLLASILRAKKTQDDNRRLDLETIYKADHGDAAVRIWGQYKPEEIQDIRRIFTLGMPKFAAEFLEHYTRLQSELNVRGIVEFPVPSRFLFNALPALTVMALFGQDYKAFYQKLCRSRRSSLQSSTVETPSAVLYERLFRVSNVHPNENNPRLVVRISDLLVNDELIGDLNRSRCGVYVMADKKIAVIDLIAAQSRGGILEGWNEYRGMSHRNLKHSIEQHPLAIRGTDEYDNEGIPRFVRSMGTAYNASTLAAVRIGELMQEIRENFVAAKPVDSVGPTAVPGAAGGGSNDNNI